jgi:hypothetical protein
MSDKFFAVYDTKVGVYLNPLKFRTNGQALRWFADLSVNMDTDVGKHPEDYTLFEIADWDEEKGVFTNLNTPKSLATAIEFASREEQ